jgi:hypothetical protein
MGTLFVLFLTACGSGPLSLSDYVDSINEIVEEGTDRLEAIYLEYGEIPVPTLAETRDLFEREVVVRVDLQAALTALNPPDQIAEIHTALADWHSGLIETEEALIARLAQASDWSEAEQSVEAHAYDAQLAAGLVVCREMQETFDATAERGAYADTPWLPAELKEVVHAVLGCGPDLE